MKPDRATAVRMLDEHVQKSIDSLPSKYKESLILRDIQGMSYKEISKIIDVPVGTVKSRLHRATQDLRSALEADLRPTRAVTQPERVTR